MSRRAALGAAAAAAAALLLLPARPARAQAGDPAPPVPTPPPADPADPTAPALPPPADPVATPAPAPSLEDLVDVFDDKNRVPENPALDVLDANGQKVVKPGAVKDLATDLRAVYVGGKVVPQIAVELVPYALAVGRRTTYDDYRRRAWVPILHRLSVSIATTTVGTAPDQATVGALGVRVRLIDRSDWRLDREAVSCAIAAATLAKPPSQPGTAVVVPVDDEATKREAKQVQACFDKAKQRTGSWNASQLALGGALSSAFPGGKLEADVRDLTGWIAWGNRLGPSAHLVVAGKYLFSDTRKDGGLRLPARHSASIAAEVERRGDRFGVLGSLGVGRRWSDDPVAMEWTGAWVGHVGAGVQLRISGATWIELGVSTQLVDGGDDDFVSLANFKWNFDVTPSKAK